MTVGRILCYKFTQQCGLMIKHEQQAINDLYLIRSRVGKLLQTSIYLTDCQLNIGLHCSSAYYRWCCRLRFPFASAMITCVPSLLFITARRYASAVYAMALCPCLCLITSRCSTKTAERRITQTKPRDSSGTLVL